MNADAQRPAARRRTVRKMTASTSRGGAPAQERKLRTQGRETLRKLLDAGMIVFDRRGYHAARVDDIVKVAKTSHGTFYLYFANKEDLFWALLSDVSEEMTALSASLGAVSPGRKGYDELRNWLERFVDLYRRYAPVIRAWTESETDAGERGVFGAEVLSRFARRLSDRIREVDPPPGLDPDVAALAMVAMIERFSYYVLTRSVSIDHEELLDTLATMLHIGVFGGTRTRRSVAVTAAPPPAVVPAG
jgi:AcrR family transcriptional regulator